MRHHVDKTPACFARRSLRGIDSLRIPNVQRTYIYNPPPLPLYKYHENSTRNANTQSPRISYIVRESYAIGVTAILSPKKYCTRVLCFCLIWLRRVPGKGARPGQLDRLATAVGDLDALFQLSVDVEDTPLIFPFFSWCVEADLPGLVKHFKPKIVCAVIESLANPGI